MGFVFRSISDATDSLHFAQPARALRFYNFVCSSEGSKARRRELGDNETDREIISFYVQYHYLLSRNDTTGSNALIGAWQKKLGHRNLWEDFNLVYEGGPPPKSGGRHIRSRPARAATRKSTGCIPAPNPVRKANHLPRRRSAEYHYFSDSSLTPLPSSDDEDDTQPQFATMGLPRPSSPSSGEALSCPTADSPPGGSRYYMAQGISHHYTHQDENMDLEDAPPPTPPQDIGGPNDPLYYEPVDSMAVLTEVADDPMNGTSVSAMCLRSGRELSLPVTKPNNTKSLSAPVPCSSSAPHTKRRRKTNGSTKKKRKKVENAEETTDQPMVIDTPAADPEPEPEPLIIEPVRQDVAPRELFIPRLEPSEPPPLKISILPSPFIPPIVQESRVPFSASRPNILLPQPIPASNPDPSPDDLKGLNDTPVAATSGFSRPTLPSNPPIWAQVMAVRHSGGTDSNEGLVASRTLRILQLLQGISKWRLL